MRKLIKACQFIIGTLLLFVIIWMGIIIIILMLAARASWKLIKENWSEDHLTRGYKIEKK